jgi:hypothetical protein
MAKIAEVVKLKGMDNLSSLNDIWGNTIALGLSSSDITLVSVNSNNFKYYVEVFVRTYDDETLNMGVFNTVARPRDLSGFQSGYGALSIGPIAKSTLFTTPTGTVGQEVYGITQAQQSKEYNYPDFLFPTPRIEWQAGYSYNPDLDVEAIIVNVAGDDYLGFTMSVVNPFFTSGIINVTSDNPYITGNHVVSANGLATYSFATTTLYTADMSTATNVARIVSYFSPADIFENSRYGFDGTQNYKEYNIPYDYLIVDGTLYNYGDGGNFNFLSSYPNRRTGTSSVIDCNAQCFSIAKRTRLDTYETISAIIDSGINVGSQMFARYKTYDSGNNLLTTTYSTFTNYVLETPKLVRMDFPIGTINKNWGPNVKYFSIQLVERVIEESVIYVPYTELRYFYIDDSCTIYDPVQVMFKNRFGAWEYFTFTQDKKKRDSISRTEIKKEMNWGEITNANTKAFRGRQVISSSVDEEFVLNSNWISEIEYEWLSQLIESNDVYVLENYVGQSLPYPVPIMITDTSYEFKTSNRDQLFNLTINYRYAVQKGTQTQ